MAFFLIPAKTIHSSPGPVLPPTDGPAQSSIPWLDRGSSAGPLPRPAFAALSACLRNTQHPQTSIVAKVYGAACWPGLPLSLIPCNQSSGPKSGKGDLVSNWNLVSCPLTPLPEETIDNGRLRPVTQHFCFLPGLFSSPILSLSTLPPSICPAPKSSTCTSHSLQAIPLSKMGDESMGIAHRDESSFQSCREKSHRQDTWRTSPCSLCLHHSHFLPSAGTTTGNISKRYLCLQSCIDSQVPVNVGYTSLMGVNSGINITCCFVKM